MSALPVNYLISTFVTLFVVVDPVGLAPTFVAITHGLPISARRQIAIERAIGGEHFIEIEIFQDAAASCGAEIPAQFFVARQ